MRFEGLIDLEEKIRRDQRAFMDHMGNFHFKSRRQLRRRFSQAFQKVWLRKALKGGKCHVKIGAIGLVAEFCARGPWLMGRSISRSSQTESAKRHVYNSRALKFRFKLFDDLRSKFGMLAGQTIQHLPRFSQFFTGEYDVKFIRARSEPTSRTLFELSFFRIGPE